MRGAGEVGSGERAEVAVVPGGTVRSPVVRAWLALLGLASVLFVVPNRPSDYLTTFWVLSYQRGYRARALPAAVLEVLGVERVTHRMVAAIAVVTLLAVLALLVHLATRAYDADPSWTTLLLGAVAVASPVTVRGLGYELGTFDAFTVLALLASLALLLRPGSDLVRLVGVGALGTVAVLVHEAYVVLALPVVVAATVVRAGGRDRARLVAHVAVVAVGPVLALGWLQAAPTIPRSELWERVEEVHAASEVDPDQPRVRWPILNHMRSLDAEIDHTADQVAERGHLLHLAALAGWAPVVVVAGAVGRSWLAPGRRRPAAVLWAGVVVAPLGLGVVAHDWGRWLTFSALAALVAVLWFGARRGREAGTPAPVPWWVAHASVGLVALSLVSPVLGRSGGFVTRVGEPVQLLRRLLGW